MIEKDGGPAFPGFAHTAGHGNQRRVDFGDGSFGWETWMPGMTVRQYFAAAALTGWAGGRNNNGGDFFASSKPGDIAAACYRYADAMIAEGEK